MKKILLLSAFSAFFSMNAQQAHTVEKGDTAYNIARRYGMSLDELVSLNPTVKEGSIQIGQVLSVKSPVKGASAQSSSVREALGYIVLEPKQTIYGLTKQYRISESELRRLNPDLDNNMKIGSKVFLPKDKIERYGAGQSAVETSVANVSEKTSEEGTYTVQAKDNYYRITRRYNLTQQELFAMNPGLEAKGLQVGDVIVVRKTGQAALENKTASVSESKSSSAASLPLEDYVTYTVANGDTVFGILNRYNITLDDLLRLNPEIENGLKPGLVLKLRKLDSHYIKKSADALHVVLMLPFGFETNDSKYRALAQDFLLGAKLAIERNAAAGQKLNVNVVDAGSETSFKNSLSQINKNNTDLIVGPFFKSNVLEVLDYVGDSKIPVVAPFANSEDLYGYDHLIIVETSDKAYAERMVEETVKVYANQKIYIVADAGRTNANIIKSGLEKALRAPEIKVVASASEIVLDQNMMTGQAAPVVAILATKDDAVGSGFTQKMIALSQQTSGIRAMSMYYHPSFEKNEDELVQANLVYLMDRKIDSEGRFEKEVLKDYKKKYCKTPSKYAVIGFDVMNDILSRETSTGEVFKQIEKVQTQLATKFEYVRAKRGGAYVNTGYRVVRLMP
ncbi:LysM peptidoglycan-binding domain-containing protein [Bergeyella sp. RCAD1439]|uniref:LysM peptidoglycan-binding domain-containing protein n=1 Tax=Bergeyella anatis TaxID=3113737 RepID=UPI002E16E0A9|nr:LysM peptidoglycan-binding domain-containing protein [Bergeyella sp. RCAD1439]